MSDSEANSLAAALRPGAELFNRGEYHAALDAFEEPYHEEGFEPRELVLGLIRVSAALYHLCGGRRVSAIRLYRSGSELLARFQSKSCGLEMQEFLERLEQTFRPLLELEASEADGLRPQIKPQLQLRG